MHCFKRLIKISLILMLTVGVVCSCCSCGIESSATTIATTFSETFFTEDLGILKGYEFKNEKNEEVLEKAVSLFSVSVDYATLKAYSNFLDSTFSSSVITRAKWLSQLLTKLDFEIITDKSDDYARVLDKDYFDYSEYFITAIENSIIGPNSSEFDPYCAVTRQYVSTSLINAVGYPRTYKLKCSDYKKIEDKTQAAASVHLGYFELDENNRFNPYGTVNEDQIDYILSELDKLKVLKNKTVMTFGDSIMHGDGNCFVGIADMLSQRYLMTPIDYSKGGSTFGRVTNRQQITSQISRASNENEIADIILINGGTNDMRKSKPGSISDDFDYEKYGCEDFCSGMEYALGTLKDYYPDTPVVYIRVHNMEYGIERNELHFGNLALDICEKWDIDVVDIFNETDFNTHDKEQKNIYTVHTKTCKNGDSIHPNKLGYYKFYIPLISEKAVEILGE